MPRRLATLVLGAQDRDALLAALGSPPKPAARLREAAKRHRRRHRRAVKVAVRRLDERADRDVFRLRGGGA